MNVFFEDSGRYNIAVLLKKNHTTVWLQFNENQVKKIKSSKLIFEFEEPLTGFWEQAFKEKEHYDYQNIWTLVQGKEIFFYDYLKQHLNHKPNAYQMAGFILALSTDPIYFYKKGAGKFQAATQKNLAKAIDSRLRKQQQKKEKEKLKHNLIQGIIPDEIKKDIYAILFNNSKHLLVYQALKELADEEGLSLEQYALKLKIFEDSLDYWMKMFIYKNNYICEDINTFPTDYWKDSMVANEAIKAFSIDSEDTREIDDAISFSKIDPGKCQIGIHIALPCFAIRNNKKLEEMMVNNVSSVYLPHTKFTLLPEKWIQSFTLKEKKWRPVISAYFIVEENTGKLLDKYSKIEKIKIEKNISLEFFDSYLPENDTSSFNLPEEVEFSESINWLISWCRKQQTKRLGKTVQALTKDEFSVKVHQDHILVKKRKRNDAIELMISELMVLTNSYWAEELEKNNKPAIYRIQKKESEPVYFHHDSSYHKSMNLKCYAWFTSPLRRLADYINQIQLVSILSQDLTHELCFEEEELKKILKIIQHKFYHIQEFQKKIEQYWCLKLIRDQKIEYINCKLEKNSTLRALDFPLKIKQKNLMTMIVSQNIIRLKINKINLENLEMDLSISA